MSNPRLIVLEEEEVEWLRRLPVQEDVVILDHEAINLLRSFVARYEDGVTRDEYEATWDVPMWMQLSEQEMVRQEERSDSYHRKLRAAFTPPTQRSDSE